mgnify:FL=1
MTVGLVAALTLVAPVAADSQVRPIKGQVFGDVVYVEGGDYAECDAGYPGMGAEYVAYGNVAHLGKTTMTGSHCASEAAAGSLTLVAANGDEISIDYTPVEACDYPSATTATCDFDAIVTGGTGRFEDATGDLTLNVDFADISGFPIWPAVFTWTGTIGY